MGWERERDTHKPRPNTERKELKMKKSQRQKRKMLNVSYTRIEERFVNLHTNWLFTVYTFCFSFRFSFGFVKFDHCYESDCAKNDICRAHLAKKKKTQKTKKKLDIVWLTWKCFQHFTDIEMLTEWLYHVSSKNSHTWIDMVKWNSMKIKAMLYIKQIRWFEYIYLFIYLIWFVCHTSSSRNNSSELIVPNIFCLVISLRCFFSFFRRSFSRSVFSRSRSPTPTPFFIKLNILH